MRNLRSWVLLVAFTACSACGSSTASVVSQKDASDARPGLDASRDTGRTSGDSGDAGKAVDAAADVSSQDSATPDAREASVDAGGRPDAPSLDAQLDAGSPIIDLAVGDDPDASTPVVTVQISIGGSPPFTALVDTGSVGLHVVEGTIPEADWTVTSTATSTTYGTGVITDGVIANAVVTVGGVATNGPISMVKITSVSCVASKPNCPAMGETASAYRYRGDYPANIGIGMRANATDNIASPIAAMGHNKQYLLKLPAFGGSVGTIVIDPSASEISRFAGTLLQLPSKGATTPSGVPGWDDTQVPYCLNSFCSVGILDTGAAAVTIDPGSAMGYTQIGVANGATSVPSGTLVNMAIDTTAKWSFTVESQPVDGKDVINLGGSTVTGNDNLSIAPFFVFDMSYDYEHGTIGLASKQ